MQIDDLRGEGGPDGVSEEELSWLEGLANGATVAEIAAQSGWSERHMYRRLNAIYIRLGVRNWSHAISRVRRANSPGQPPPGTSSTAPGGGPTHNEVDARTTEEELT